MLKIQIISKNFFILAIFATILSGSLNMGKVSAFAGLTDNQKGANIQSRWNTDFGSDSFKQSVSKLRATGADTVILVIPLRQANIYAIDIYAGGNTPTDEALLTGTRYAQSIGLRVNWKFFVDSDDGAWRATITPWNKGEWFKNYTNFILKYGRLAQSTNVEMIVIGTEMAKLTMPQYGAENTGYWKKLIADLRGVYSGKLTYGANHGDPFKEKDEIGFWGDLDLVGISAYFPLTQNGYAGVQELKDNWARVDNTDIKPLYQRYGKPIYFTEIGYKATDQTFKSPGDSAVDGNFNEEAQANGYEAMFQYFSNVGYVKGVQLWDWNSDPNYGYGNKDYSPQNKKAEAVMKKYFSGTSSTGGGTLPPVNPPAPAPAPINTKYTTSATVQGATVNADLPVTVTVKNTGINNAANDSYLVDVEIYQNDTSRVYQYTHAGKALNAGANTTFVSSWKPNGAGNYTVKVGIFAANWTSLYDWNNDAARVSVALNTPPTPVPNPTPTPTPQPNPTPAPVPQIITNLDVWWPTDGATISGVQPFKAVTNSGDLNSYKMYWQVDGGGLVEMYNTTADGGHKQADVDVSGWKWNSSNKYKLNFVAKDNAGKIVAQKAVSVNIYN
jgi:CARDB